MSHKDHEHRGTEGTANGQKHEHGHAHPSKPRGLHRDWRLWAGVVLALVAMAIYVLSMDDASVYGDRFYLYTFKQAIADGFISDYRIVTVTVTVVS